MKRRQEYFGQDEFSIITYYHRTGEAAYCNILGWNKGKWGRLLSDLTPEFAHIWVETELNRKETVSSIGDY